MASIKVMSEERYQITHEVCIEYLTDIQTRLFEQIKVFNNPEAMNSHKFIAADEAIYLLGKLKRVATALDAYELFYLGELRYKHDDIVNMWNYIHPEEPIT